MIRKIIGIDPGLDGGIAVIQGKEILLLDRAPIIRPKSPGKKREFDSAKMTELLEKYAGPDAVVYIEQVGAMPLQGVVSMFNFGKGYGMWLGICAGLKIKYKLVTPKTWKNRMIPGKVKTKDESISRVRHFFPNVDLKPGRTYKDHDGMAEALLIAMYGGMIEWA